jgi:tetratricopeptide (TPR) repeat protein
MKPMKFRLSIALLFISGILIYTSILWWYGHLSNSSEPVFEPTQATIGVSDITYDEDSGLSQNQNYKNAVAAFLNKDYILAVRELDDEIVNHPNHAQAYYFLGRIYEDVSFPSGKYLTKMATNYEKYIERKPNGIRVEEAKLKLAQLYLKNGLTQQNAELLDKAEQYLKSLDQENNDVRMALGAIYLDKRNFQEAISQFEKSANLQPNELRLKYNSLGLAYIKIGSFDKAERVLNIAIQIKPDDKFAHNNLGFVYLRLRKYKEARLEFTEALRIDPTYMNAKSNLEWVNTLN